MAGRLGLADPYRRGTSAAARDVSDRGHDRKNDRRGKSNRKGGKYKPRDHIALPYSNTNQLNLSPSILLHALPGEVWAVQDVLPPFVNLDDGGSHGGDGGNKHS